MVNHVRLVCALTLALSVLGCSDRTSKVVGNWQGSQTGGDEAQKAPKEFAFRVAYEFMKDGTFVRYEGRDTRQQKGTWKILDDGRLQVVNDWYGGRVVRYNVEIGDTFAVFTNGPGGERLEMKKVGIIDFSEMKSPTAAPPG